MHLVEISVVDQRYQAVVAVIQDGWKVSEVALRGGGRSTRWVQSAAAELMRQKLSTRGSSVDKTQPDPLPSDIFSLVDWKRQVQELYVAVRHEEDPQRGWLMWREGRERLFRHHPQSPIPARERESFGGIAYFDYDRSFRVEASFDPLEKSVSLPGSTGSAFDSQLCGRLRFELHGIPHQLATYWIGGYGGGLFVPFRDSSSAESTYGGGRYLLDTIKGADLGSVGDRVLLDFNFAYNPSCSYDARWACPLPPSENSLRLEIRAGERSADAA